MLRCQATMTTSDQYSSPWFSPAQQGMPQPGTHGFGDMLDSEYIDRLDRQLYAEIPGSMSIADNQRPAENSTAQLPMNSSDLQQLLGNLDEPRVTGMPAIPHPGCQPRCYFLPGSES